MAFFQYCNFTLSGLVLLTLTAAPVFAENAIAPVLHAGDTWTYVNSHEVNGAGRKTHNESTVVRSSAMGILLSTKEVGSTLPPKEMLWGSDWSHSKSIDGKEQITAKPFDFPLNQGKTWIIDYTVSSPDRMHKNEHFHFQYAVTGTEKVTVPAGTFDAIRIEADGQWTAETAKAATATSIARTDAQGAVTAAKVDKMEPKTFTGRLYRAFWYVPEVKRYVKGVEEYYTINGTLGQRDTAELESYKVAP